MKAYFGFDTSNYTTSFAAVSSDGKVMANCKRKLGVKSGERGLRQSDAVFQHATAGDFFEKSIKDFFEKYPDAEVKAVGYSKRPRDVENSYMPCFVVGETVAKSVSSSLKVENFSFSHQAGHVAAALLSSGSSELVGEKFAAFHVSGGTSDVLLIDGFENGTFGIKQIGGTLDLNAGQVIDRVGVAMGLSFPAGPETEKLAARCKTAPRNFKPCVKGLEFNISGIENLSAKIYGETNSKEETASFVINAVGKTLFEVSKNLLELYPHIPIVYAGGVMSCGILKNMLSEFSNRFAAPELSSDNAAGIAYLTMLSDEKRV